MKLTCLSIQALPGITPGFTLNDLAPGVNLITGPNAVGKSSIIRALRYLVGDVHRTDPPALVLSAVFEDGDNNWTVRRTGATITWEMNGQTVLRPSLVEKDQLYCYWLSMEDLLAANERDNTLARRLQQELSGGYDLAALRDDDLFSVKARIGQAEEKGVSKADRALKEVQRDYEDLHRQENEIPRLEEQAGEARNAAARAGLLERALELITACRQAQQILAELEEFPANMNCLAGNEIQRLDDLEGQSREREGEIQEAIIRRDQATCELENTGLAGGQPNNADLNVVSEVLQQARGKRTERDAEQRLLAEAEAAENQSLTELGRQGAQVPVLSPDTVARAETFAREYQNARAHRDNFQGQLQGKTDAPDPQTIEAYREAVSALREWLASEAGASRTMLYGIIAVFIGGAITMVTALFAQAWLVLLGGMVILAATLYLFLLLRVNGGAQAKRRFEFSRLQPPRAWERNSVEERLDAIDREKSRLENARDRAQTYHALSQNFARAEQQLNLLEVQRTELRNEIGFEPNTPAAFDRFIRLAQNYDAARNNREHRITNIDRLNTAIEDAINQACQFLSNWGALPANRTLESVHEYINDLNTRLRTAEDAIRRRDSAELEVGRFKRELDGINRQKETLFQEAGVEDGSQATLEQRLNNLHLWREKQNSLIEAKGREAALRQPLAGHDDLLQRVLNDDQNSLETELQNRRGTAASLEGIEQRLTEIRTRLHDAGHGFRMEAALREKNKALADLKEKYQEALFAKTAYFFLDSVIHEFTTEHEPEVLRKAREFFMSFTHHNYDFELSQDNTFTARDVNCNEYRTLEHLSSATRMQLLLAVRVAWTRNIEQRCNALPFFFDEALTNSDERRFTVVAQSLQTLAEEEGRQIFYLSAREHELDLWERAANIRPLHINLTQVRFGQNDADQEDYMLPVQEPIPLPDGRTAEEYAAAVGVPHVTPNHYEGTLHLFYLLRDNLALLHHLLETWRIHTMGQLESLLDSNAASNAIPDNQWRARLAGRCIAAKAWMGTWCIGRGRVVDRSALEQSEAVSDTFIDRVTELADTHNGNGTILVSALREGGVRRFQQNSIEELNTWLEENGYIDTRDVLTREERSQRTLEMIGDRVEPDEINRVVSWLEGRIGD